MTEDDFKIKAAAFYLCGDIEEAYEIMEKEFEEKPEQFCSVACEDYEAVSVNVLVSLIDDLADTMYRIYMNTANVFFNAGMRFGIMPSDENVFTTVITKHKL